MIIAHFKGATRNESWFLKPLDKCVQKWSEFDEKCTSLPKVFKVAARFFLGVTFGTGIICSLFPAVPGTIFKSLFSSTATTRIENWQIDLDPTFNEHCKNVHDITSLFQGEIGASPVRMEQSLNAIIPETVRNRIQVQTQPAEHVDPRTPSLWRNKVVITLHPNRSKWVLLNPLVNCFYKKTDAEIVRKLPDLILNIKRNGTTKESYEELTQAVKRFHAVVLTISDFKTAEIEISR